MRLSHNLASLNVYQSYSKNLKAQSVAMERISSGYKINKSKDDPNAMSESERLRIQIRGLQMAGRNVQDGVSMLQTAEGGLDGITQMLQRMKELTVQYANGTNSPDDKNAIQKEITQMVQGIESIATSTEFNGNKLLSGNGTDNSNPQVLQMLAGSNAGETVDVPMYNLTSSMLGKLGGTASLSTLENSLGNTDDALKIIDSSINEVLSIRGKYGALENRFEDSLTNIQEGALRMENVDSIIRDADVAEEMIEVSKTNLLTQAGNAMMVQTNKFPQDILRILENVKSR